MSGPVQLERRIEELLAADDRTRKRLLKELLPEIRTREEAALLAPALRGPSPRVAARVTSLLARFELGEVFEAQLAGLKPGKVDLLRRQFLRIRSEG
jgi:hypothetical protein